MECDPDNVGVKENTCSSPGVDHGPPRPFHAPDPERLNDPVLPQVSELILEHGFTAGAPVIRVALSVMQLL